MPICQKNITPSAAKRAGMQKKDWAFIRRHPLLGLKFFRGIGANIYKSDPAIYDSYSMLPILPDAAPSFASIAKKVASENGGRIKILDLGCGTAAFALSQLPKLGISAEYVGIDINRRFLDFARTKSNGMADGAGGASFEFFLGDVCSISTLNQVVQACGKFDLALCINTYGSIKSGKREGFAGYAYQYLAPGGMLAVHEFCLELKRLDGCFARRLNAKEEERSALRFYARFLDYAEKEIGLTKSQRFALKNSAYLAARPDKVCMPLRHELEQHLWKVGFSIFGEAHANALLAPKGLPEKTVPGSHTILAQKPM